jgi:hypothetical protein
LITFDTYDLLAFDDAPEPSNLFTVRPDGSRLRALTHFETGGDRVAAATFTPDGERILSPTRLAVPARLAASASTAVLCRSSRRTTAGR